MTRELTTTEMGQALKSSLAMLFLAIGACASFEPGASLQEIEEAVFIDSTDSVTPQEAKELTNIGYDAFTRTHKATLGKLVREQGKDYLLTWTLVSMLPEGTSSWQHALIISEIRDSWAFYESVRDQRGQVLPVRWDLSERSVLSGHLSGKVLEKLVVTVPRYRFSGDVTSVRLRMFGKRGFRDIAMPRGLLEGFYAALDRFSVSATQSQQGTVGGSNDA